MTTAMKVFGTRNKKFGLAEKLNDDTYSVTFEDGETKEINVATFKRWYKEVDAEDLAPKSTDETEAPASTPEASETSDADAEAKKAAEEAEATRKAEEKAKKDAEKAAKAEAKAAEKAKKDEEKSAAKEAKEKERAEAKAKKEAEKAAKVSRPKSDGKAKERNKIFFIDFARELARTYSGYSKANPRERNYMSFPAGASGFKYKFVKTNDKLTASLYIFGEAVVTDALFKKLEAYKAEIESKLAGLPLEWEANDELKVRRVKVTLTGSDEVLVKEGIKILLLFKETFTPYIDAITA